jgi:hypothetical protein
MTRVTSLFETGVRNNRESYACALLPMPRSKVVLGYCIVNDHPLSVNETEYADYSGRNLVLFVCQNHTRFEVFAANACNSIVLTPGAIFHVETRFISMVVIALVVE